MRRPDAKVWRVAASRVKGGAWKDEKWHRGGDIKESYSADRISEGKPVRSPFRHDGKLYVCTSMCGKGLTESKLEEFCAYRLVRLESFDGTPTTYAEKTKYLYRRKCPKNKDARLDPLGFYHGMTVRSNSVNYVMVGPEEVFIESAEEVGQLALF